MCGADSGIVNMDSGERQKMFTITPECVFTMNQNGCSRWARISVHDEPEYAKMVKISKKPLGNPDRPTFIRQIKREAGILYARNHSALRVMEAEIEQSR